MVKVELIVKKTQCLIFEMFPKVLEYLGMKYLVSHLSLYGLTERIKIYMNSTYMTQMFTITENLALL